MISEGYSMPEDMPEPKTAQGIAAEALAECIRPTEEGYECRWCRSDLTTEAEGHDRDCPYNALKEIALTPDALSALTASEARVKELEEQVARLGNELRFYKYPELRQLSDSIGNNR